MAFPSIIMTSLVAQMVKCLSTMWETWVRSLGWEDSLKKEMATHSSTLALKISWTEELGAGYCPWGRKESGTTEWLHFSIIKGFPWWLRRESLCLQCGRPGFQPWVGKIPWRRKWQSIPVLLPGKFHGQRSLVGYSLWGHKESDMTEQLHFHFHFPWWLRW